jgi:hypothetical protein
MPIMIRELDLERRLTQHGRRLPAPVSKAELIRAIAAVVMDAADAKGIDVGQVLTDLRPRRDERKAPAKVA